MVNTEIRWIIFFAAEDGKALYNQQKQDQELTGSDHELLIAKFRLKFQKVGKTTRPFRYELNKIPFTMEVANRFKGFNLIDRVHEELWIEVRNIVLEVVTKTTPKKKKCKKAKWLSEEALQIAEKRSENQRRKGKIYPTEYRVLENSRER